MGQGKTSANRANALEQEAINLRAQHAKDIATLQQVINEQAKAQKQMTEGLLVQMAIKMQKLAGLEPTATTTTRLNRRCKFQQPRELRQALIGCNHGHKRGGSKMEENKTDKMKESNKEENHQGREIREVETKILLPLRKAMTPIPPMMDQIMAAEEVEKITQAGDLTGEI